MRKRTTISIIASSAVLLAVIAAFCAGKKILRPLFGPPGEFSEHAFEQTVNKTFHGKYLLYLPDNYNDSEKPFPLILYLHGTGERGESLKTIENSGLPAALSHVDTPPYILLAPLCPRNKWWTDSDMLQTVMAMLDEVCNTYRVDRTRVYLTGASMGGFGAWELGIQFPDRFAAVAPLAARGNPYLVHRLKHTPVRIYHGVKDSVVPVVCAKEMQVQLEPHENVEAIYYPDLAHDIWTTTYRNPEFYEWLFAQRKGRPMKKISSDD